MITWTSDRSGIASSGVVLIAHTPPAKIAALASSTRNRLWSDHSMILLIMAVLLVLRHRLGIRL